MNRNIRSRFFSGVFSFLAVFLSVLVWDPGVGIEAEAESATPFSGKVEGAQQAAPSRASVNPAPRLRHLVLNFDDIPCVGHVRSILDAMGGIKGTSNHKVLFEEKRGELDYDPSVVSPDAIVKGMPWDCPARVAGDTDIP